jgi:hypothetical protein
VRQAHCVTKYHFLSLEDWKCPTTIFYAEKLLFVLRGSPRVTIGHGSSHRSEMTEQSDTGKFVPITRAFLYRITIFNSARPRAKRSASHHLSCCDQPRGKDHGGVAADAGIRWSEIDVFITSRLAGIESAASSHSCFPFTRCSRVSYCFCVYHTDQIS